MYIATRETLKEVRKFSRSNYSTHNNVSSLLWVTFRNQFCLSNVSQRTKI